MAVTYSSPAERHRAGLRVAAGLDYRLKATLSNTAWGRRFLRGRTGSVPRLKTWLTRSSAFLDLILGQVAKPHFNVLGAGGGGTLASKAGKSKSKKKLGASQSRALRRRRLALS